MESREGKRVDDDCGSCGVLVPLQRALERRGGYLDDAGGASFVIEEGV